MGSSGGSAIGIVEIGVGSAMRAQPVDDQRPARQAEVIRSPGQLLGVASQ
jgi:hypothetical protein